VNPLDTLRTLIEHAEAGGAPSAFLRDAATEGMNDHAEISAPSPQPTPEAAPVRRGRPNSCVTSRHLNLSIGCLATNCPQADRLESPHRG
jgi:hypothetical protein